MFIHNSSPPHIHRCDHAFFRRKCACRIKTSTPPSKHPRSKESKRRNPSFEFRPHQTSQPASSHPRPVSSTESRLRNPSFEFRPHHCHQTSKPASSHPRPRNPSFEIHASDFGDIETTRRLRRIHVHEIQASDFDLCCNRYDHSTIAFLLYTFVGNDGQRAPALTRQKVRARAFSRRARFHLACPLPQSN